MSTTEQGSGPPGRVAVLCNTAGGGGMTRVVMNLLKGLAARGVPADLVVDKAEGKPYVARVPPGVRVVDLGVRATGGTRGVLRIVRPLARYLRRERPSLLTSHLVDKNVVVVLAAALARVPVHVSLVEHLPMGEKWSGAGGAGRVLTALRRLLYPRAGSVVAVSKGQAGKLETYLRMRPGSVRTIYNPIVDDELARAAGEPADHPWLRAGGPPVVMGIGRLAPQKDFHTLLRATAEVRRRRPVRLMILGEGEDRAALEQAAERLGLGPDVQFPGFVVNPHAYLRRAAVFALSSRWETFGNVIVEAMACGCQIVSTDCPDGPAEILDGGRFGRLVPVGDAGELARAIELALDSPLDPGECARRAQEFTVDRAVTEYLALSPSALSQRLSGEPQP